MQREVLQRTALHGIHQIAVAFPLAAATIRQLDIATVGIAIHQLEAGQAEIGKAVVVAQLPAALIAVGKVVDLYQVGQEGIGPVQIGKTGFALHLLIAAGELVHAGLPRQGGAAHAVVDVAAAGVAAVGMTQVQRQCAVAERLAVVEHQIVLTVDRLQLAVVVAELARVADSPGGAGKVEGIAVLFAGNYYVACSALHRAHVLVIGGITQVDRVEAAQLQLQTVAALSLQPAAAKALRQQAAVVMHGDRQGRNQSAEAQNVFIQPEFGGQPQLAVFVHRAVFTGIALENTGAGAIRAGVQLDAQQADGVQTEAQTTFGVTGLPIGAHALGPFIGLALGCIALAKVAVEVEIAQLDAALGVINKGSAGRSRHQGGKGGQHKGLGLFHCLMSLVFIGQSVVSASVF